MKYYATVFSGVIAALLISSFVPQAFAADLQALMVPARESMTPSYIGVKTVTLNYAEGSPISQALDGESRRISFTLNGNATEGDTSGITNLIGSINNGLLEARSPAHASAVTVSYSAVLRGDETRTTISYKTEIKPVIENYVLEVQESAGSQIVDLEWRGIVVHGPIVLNAPEIGEIDVNNPIGLLQTLYPTVAEKLANTPAIEVLEDPILAFEEFNAPMSAWQFLFDPVGAYGGSVELQGTEGANVLSVFSLGESSIREGTHSVQEKDATVTVDGGNVRVQSSTPPPSGQITVAGYAVDQESGGSEFATVTADAPAGAATATGGFPIQVLLVLGGMMGAIAIFILYKARK